MVSVLFFYAKTTNEEKDGMKKNVEKENVIETIEWGSGLS